MKRIISLLLVFTMLSIIPACVTDQSPSTLSSPDSGIQRVVPSGPLAQMMLLSLAPDLMAGISSEWDSTAVDFLPAEILSLPYLGRLFNGADTNLESLALAAPQLIIDIGESRSASESDYKTLEAQTGIPTVFIPATLETMPDAFRSLGQLLHREERAEQLAQFCERVYSRTVEIMNTVGTNKVNVLYILGEEGLNVLAKGSYHAEVLDFLTNNLAVVDTPSSKGLGNAVSLEQIAVWAPDVILFAPDSIYDIAAEAETWSGFTAIACNRYVEVPSGPYNWMGNPPGVQRYLSLIWLPALLYPEFCDYDVRTEVKTFYELFYNCSLTDTQYDELTRSAFFSEDR